MTLYMVIDHKGYVRPYTSFKEAKCVFERMVNACKHVQTDNETFRYRFTNVQDGNDTIKQFQSNYKNVNGKWINEWYTLQTTTID